MVVVYLILHAGPQVFMELYGHEVEKIREGCETINR